jgi:phosphoglycolate phosphatase-like HAD superfamily hydrolase
LIIFDIDGTLLQTDLVTVPAVQRTFAAHGLPQPDAETICSYFGRPVEEYLAWLASLCPPGHAAEIIAATNRLELELIGREGRLYPGAGEALAALKRDGHVLAICSNGPEDYVSEFLDAHGVRGFFDLVRTRGIKYDNKDAMVRAILGETTARPAIVVGDRHDDILAAHQNGGVAIATTYGFGSPAELRDADVPVYSPAEIPAAVRRLVERR